MFYIAVIKIAVLVLLLFTVGVIINYSRTPIIVFMALLQNKWRMCPSTHCHCLRFNPNHSCLLLAKYRVYDSISYLSFQASHQQLVELLPHKWKLQRMNPNR